MALTAGQALQLYQAGKISEDTYKAAVAATASTVPNQTVMPQASAPIGPPAPPAPAHSWQSAVPSNDNPFLGSAPDRSAGMRNLANAYNAPAPDYKVDQPIEPGTRPTGGPVGAPGSAGEGATAPGPRTFMGTPTGGGGGGKVGIPGGTQTNFDKFKQATLEANEAQLEAQLDQKLLLQTTAEKAQLRGVEKANEIGAQQAQLDKLEAQRQATEAQRKQRAEAEAAKLQQLTDDFGKSEIDNKRYFKKRGVGDTILDIVSAMAVGFAGGMKGDPMAGVKLMSMAVDRDVEAQKQAINVKGKSLEQRRSLYNDMLERFKDERLAELATKNALFEQGKMKLAMIGERQTGEVTSEKLQAAVLDISERQAVNQQQFAERIYSLEQQPGGAAYLAPARGGGGGANKDAKLAEFMSAAAPGDKLVLGGKVYVKTEGGNIIESADAGKAELNHKTNTVNSGHKAELEAEIAGLERGRNVISSIPAQEGETLPGLGIGAKLADKAASVLGDSPGRYQSESGKLVNGVLQNTFSSFKQVGENSDADAIRIKERMRGDGTKKGMTRNFDEMILKKKQELAKLNGESYEPPPTPKETPRSR